MDKEKIWHYYCSFGRMGFIEGMFVATESEIDKHIGANVYFGEVLGKHSEIYTEFDWSDLTELTEDENLIEKCVENNIVPNGYNPLDYIQEEESDEEDEEELLLEETEEE